MVKTYLAGFDGSDESRAAVDLAVLLARSEVAEVVAVNVYPYATAAYWIPVEALHHDEFQEDYRKEAEAVLDTLDVAGVAKRAVRADSPARGLHDLAVETGAKLIAVGATHRGGLGRRAPGSVAMRLIHGAPCPVLVTPSGMGDAPPRRIGVAYDGRQESIAALHAARGIAERLHARLEVVGAHAPVRLPPPMGSPGMSDILAEERRQFETTVERAAEAVDGESRVVTGAPGRTIADMGADFDLLVTGSRGYGPIGSVLLGSVSRHLVDHAHCPVLVVPRPSS